MDHPADHHQRLTHYPLHSGYPLEAAPQSYIPHEHLLSHRGANRWVQFTDRVTCKSPSTDRVTYKPPSTDRVTYEPQSTDNRVTYRQRNTDKATYQSITTTEPEPPGVTDTKLPTKPPVVTDKKPATITDPPARTYPELPDPDWQTFEG